MATKPEKSAGNAKRPDSKKKKPVFTAQDGRDQKKDAKRKGLKPGARNSVESKEQKQAREAKNKDVRVGSRKPVALVVETPVKTVKPVKPAEPKPEKKTEAAPEQQIAKWERELDKLENDDRLNALLDKLELAQAISVDDQEWLDKKLARHQELLKLLGLNEEEKEASDPDELLQRFIETDFDPKEFDSLYKKD